MIATILLLASGQRPHYVAKKLRLEGEHSVAGGTAHSDAAHPDSNSEPPQETWSQLVQGLDLPRLTRYLAVRLPGSGAPRCAPCPCPAGGRTSPMNSAMPTAGCAC